MMRCEKIINNAQSGSGKHILSRECMKVDITVCKNHKNSIKEGNRLCW